MLDQLLAQQLLVLSMVPGRLEHDPQHPDSVHNSQTQGGCVRKKRSLTRLFTSRSRKISTSQSRPPSPQTPLSPRIPECFLQSSAIPSPTTSGPPNPSKATGEKLGRWWNLESKHPGEISCRARKCLSHPRAREVVEETTAASVTNPINLQNKSIDDASISWIKDHRPSNAHPSPTLRLVHPKSHDNLQSPPAPSSSQLRGLPKSPNRLETGLPKARVLARPGTAVGNISRHDRRILLDDSQQEQPPIYHTNSAPPPGLPPDANDDGEVRASSAATYDSSLVHMSSAAPSSMVTRRTSISDSTVEIYETTSLKDGNMTVEDAINLYASGFADDSESEEDSYQNSSINEEERQRSERIAEAINDSIDADIRRDEPSAFSALHSAAPLIPPAVTRQEPEPPLLSIPTFSRDPYGFLKANHYVTVDQYDAWHATYAPMQERRNIKWRSYMLDNNLLDSVPTSFPHRSTKTQRFVRKGLPPAWRGAAWFSYARGQDHIDKHPDLYDRLLARAGTTELSDDDKDIIERDLHRTFPDNIHFKAESTPASGDPQELPLLASLRRVLQAFSLHSPKIGYCQSLNFIAGLLLLFLPEEKVFWMLHIITTEILPGTHEISLEGANVDLWVLMTALKENFPVIWAKVTSGEDSAGTLGTKLPPISLCTTSWFMSLFIGTLPIESVLRVWDVLFYEGSKTLFRVAIAIFKIGEQRIRQVSDSMEMFQVVQTLPRELLDVGSLMNVAFRRGGVSHDWIEKKRKERRQWYAAQRARISGAVAADDHDEDSVTENPKRAESLWRRKRK